MGQDGTAGMEKAEVADLHEAMGQDMVEEPAEKLDGVEGGGAWASTARLAGGEGDGAVVERDEAAIGDGPLQPEGAR
jgi:hypothetical protein